MRYKFLLFARLKGKEAEAAMFKKGSKREHVGLIDRLRSYLILSTPYDYAASLGTSEPRGDRLGRIDELAKLQERMNREGIDRAAADDHPPDEELELYTLHLDRLPVERRREIAAHLGECEACREDRDQYERYADSIRFDKEPCD